MVELDKNKAKATAKKLFEFSEIHAEESTVREIEEALLDAELSGFKRAMEIVKEGQKNGIHQREAQEAIPD